MVVAPVINLIQPVDWSNPLNRGLQHWWLVMPGNQYGVTWVDITKRGQDGTLSSSDAVLPFWNISEFRASFGSVSCIGENRFVDMGTIDVTAWTASSFVLWYFPTGFNVNGRYLSMNFGGADDIRFFYTSGTTTIFSMDDGSTSGQITTTMSLNTWHHVVGTHSGSTQSLYIDGELVGANAKSFNYAGTDGLLYIARGAASSPASAQGRFDGVRIYDRALSADEVKMLSMDAVRG